MGYSREVLSIAFAPLFTIYPWLGLVLVLLIILLMLRMRPRRFYFVRHGQTILNAQRIRQGDKGGLSPLGQKQAHATGNYLSRFHIKRMIVSPFERTKETAAIINSYLKVPISYSALFVERRNPSEIIGKSAEDLEVMRITGIMDGSYHDDNYRFSDEENFQDLKKRAQKALSFLSRQGPGEICVVTHGIFLKMLISYLLYRDRLHASDYVKFSFFNTANNAGVTVCEYHPWLAGSETRGWEVISYDETPPPISETVQPHAFTSSSV